MPAARNPAIRAGRSGKNLGSWGRGRVEACPRLYRNTSQMREGISRRVAGAGRATMANRRRHSLPELQNDRELVLCAPGLGTMTGEPRPGAR